MSKALQDEGGGGRVAITVAMTVAGGQCPELLAAAAYDRGVQPSLSLGAGFH